MQPRIYEFGDFELDTGSQILRSRSGATSTLPTRVFSTLLCFLERPGEVIDKSKLVAAIWPNVVVEDNNLEQQISALRHLFGERRGENRYIVTVHGRGYRFVPPVTSRDAAPISTAPLSSATPARASAQSRKRSRLPELAIVAAFALAIIGGVIAVRIGAPDKAPAPAVQRTLAVLPFKPLAAADRNESLELGMAETLIMALNTESLTVAPLSSVRRYAGIESDALAAGRELGADAVLEGSIQRDREELRVSARLLEVESGRQLWAERFDLRFTDIFAVQDAIAARVRAALLPEAAAASGPTRHMTADAEAYQLYANGRYHRQQRVSEAGLREALGYFEAAVARDPNFALAYVGLAEAHSILGAIAIVAPQEAFPKALVAVERALSIAPDLGEAYASLGHIKQQYEHDWAGAERAHRRAVELAPSYAPAQQWYGHYLAYAGQIDEGLEQIRKAQALEPTAPSYSALIGMFLNYQRRYEEAIEQLQRTLEMDEHFAIAHTYLGVAYMRLGRFDEAARHFDRMTSATPGSVSYKGQLLALSGRRDEALAEVGRLIELSKTLYVSAYDIATIFAALGDTDEALDWLERTFDDRSQLIGWLPWDPIFDGVRADPRYAAIIEKLPYRAL